MKRLLLGLFVVMGTPLNPLLYGMEKKTNTSITQQCLICLDEKDKNTLVLLPSCVHGACPECLAGWVNGQAYSFCPLRCGQQIDNRTGKVIIDPTPIDDDYLRGKGVTINRTNTKAKEVKFDSDPDTVLNYFNACRDDVYSAVTTRKINGVWYGMVP